MKEDIKTNDILIHYICTSKTQYFQGGANSVIKGMNVHQVEHTSKLMGLGAPNKCSEEMPLFTFI